MLSSDINKKEGVYYLSTLNKVFEDAYLVVREQEGRIYAIEDLQNLPYQPQNHQEEWKLRVESLERFLHYLKSKKINSCLDIGCGNGWFAHQVAINTPMQVYALDVNEFELRQGTKAFEQQNLHFVYADIFDEALHIWQESFDMITLVASVQYFRDFTETINRLKRFLKPKGEIHLIDSPFYTEKDKLAAQERTQNYYQQMGYEAMASNYFHHTWEEVEKCKAKILYQPSFWQKLKGNKNPFPWLVFQA